VQKTTAQQSPKGTAAVPKPSAELPHHRANVIVQFRSHDGELTGLPRPPDPLHWTSHTIAMPGFPAFAACWPGLSCDELQNSLSGYCSGLPPSPSYGPASCTQELSAADPLNPRIDVLLFKRRRPAAGPTARRHAGAAGDAAQRAAGQRGAPAVLLLHRRCGVGRGAWGAFAQAQRLRRDGAPHRVPAAGGVPRAARLQMHGVHAG